MYDYNELSTTEIMIDELINITKVTRYYIVKGNYYKGTLIYEIIYNDGFYRRIIFDIQSQYLPLDKTTIDYFNDVKIQKDISLNTPITKRLLMVKS